MNYNEMLIDKQTFFLEAVRREDEKKTNEMQM